MEIPRKKILMLHGYAQSADTFRAKTGGLRKSLKKLGYELYYPCAPLEIQNVSCGEAENSRNLPTNLYGWWIPDPHSDSFTVGSESRDYLRKYIIQYGPFNGIAGFSQGAALSGYLCTGVQDILGLSEAQQPDFEFLISFSGFKLEPQCYAKRYERLLQLPSLHVVGDLDTVVSEDRVITLYEACAEHSKVMLRHPGGHFVPNSTSFLHNLTSWLSSVDLNL